MVSSTHHGNGDHPLTRVMQRCRRHWRYWYLLLDPLMGSSLVEIHGIRFEKTGELLLLQDQEVIQAYSPHAQENAFANGIGAARVRYGVRSTLMPLVVATRTKCCLNWRSLSRIR